jgi:3-oxoacyl-[acyl-carrier protein] reductase
MTDFHPKSVIITGAARGIGAALAERLASDGFAVTINYPGDSTQAEMLAHRIEKAGGRALCVQADVSDAAAVRRLFNATEMAFGGVDVLINNAGIMHPVNIADADDTVFDRHVAINLKGVFNGLRQAAARLSSGGRIVSFSSSVVGLYQPDYAIYAATKAGVEAMTHIFAKELRGRNITVNAIAPGPVGTALFLDGKSRETIDQYANLSPLQRLGRPEDIADVVAFLVGPNGSWINGQVLRVNGGIV